MSPLDDAWRLVDAWPVEEASVVVVDPSGEHVHGNPNKRQRLASVSKPLSAYACLIAIEEGSISLDDPVGQTDCTVRHLLAHAGGYPFDGAQPVSRPGVKRIYSNTGFDMLAQHLEHSTSMTFGQYLREAVLAPLGMEASALEGSPARDVWSNIADLTRFLQELRWPTLISHDTYTEAVTAVFPDLSGIVPGVGPFDPCPWGLGFEIRGHKKPHWTGQDNSAATFGHFGGIGTFIWIDPVADIACAVLTEREFDQWGLEHWPRFSDEVLAGLGRGT